MRRLGESKSRPRIHTWRKWKSSEWGFSEAAAFIFVIPIIIALIFSLIEVGWYLRYRGMVDEVTRTTAVMVAAEGSNTAQPWSALNSTSFNSWSEFGSRQLRNLCKPIPMQTSNGDTVTGPITGGWGGAGSRCEQAPSMSCTPGSLQASAGADVECTARFDYKPLTSLARSTLFNLGFGGFFSKDIKVTVRSRASIGSGS